MVHIKVKRGLNIPIDGQPEGPLKDLKAPAKAALDLSRFSEIRFQLLKREGDQVAMGEPLAEDKACQGRMFVSPVSGTVLEVIRGDKRRLLQIVVELEGDRVYEAPGDGLERLMNGGAFAHIRRRPCDVLASPNALPRSIFIKGSETAPFAPSPELGLDFKLFQAGIDALKELAPVHLIGGVFDGVSGVTRHTVSGAHPASHLSLAIAKIDPIKTVEDCVWTLSVYAVLVVGSLIRDRCYYPMRVISLGGLGFKERGFYRCVSGYPLGELDFQGRLVSGDPLMGTHSPYLCIGDVVACCLSEEDKREFLHFMRPGLKRYTTFRGYASRLFNRKYRFSTMMHGEERAFVDGSVYDPVMPLPLSTMHLVKALMCEDFEKAEELGLLEVAKEDFALPTFVCPSKIEMTEIVDAALKTYAENYLSV